LHCTGLVVGATNGAGGWSEPDARRHFDRALVKLKQAHSAAPQDATIENLLGITETQLGQIDEACNHYRNAIRLDPRQAAPHRNLGFNLLNSKDYSMQSLNFAKHRASIPAITLPTTI